MAGRNEEIMVSNLPEIEIPRSTFGSKSHRHLMTANAADLNIFYTEEYLPGDTCKLNLASIIRTLTPIHPTMDNSYADFYFFSVPRRLTWTHWKNFMGENDSTYWTEENEYEIPQVTAPQTGWAKGTLADQLGIRQGVSGVSIDAQYLRSYCMIYNEWFRDENLVEPLNCPTDDTTVAGSNGTDATDDCIKGGMPAKVAKLHDVFTSALPSPQKAPDTLIPLGQTAPIIGVTPEEGEIKTNYNNINGYADLRVVDKNGTTVSDAQWGATTVKSGGVDLAANLAEATAATVNQLRQAFAVQRMYEKDARGGRAKACASSIKKSRKKTGRLNQKAS